MNKLNTIIIFLLSFVLLSPVFTTTSYAVEIGSTPVSAISPSQWPSTYPEGTYGGYTFTQVENIIASYYNNDENSEVLFNTMTSSLHADGYDLVVLNSDFSGYFFFLTKHNYFDFGIAENTSDGYNSIVFSPIVDTFTKFDFIYCTGGYVFLPKFENDSSYVYRKSYPNSSSLEPVFYSNVSVKEFSSISNQYFWDGTSYIYEPSSEPDTPTFPTNAEIASAVQKFYNSDIYKNNTNFKDFFVVYYVHNQTYAFIGHTIGDDLGQIIVPPGVREQGKLYGEQWWHFFVNENAGAPPLGTTFYLYTTSDAGESFIDDGTGKISQLIDIDFSRNAVIVYSTSDYPVRTYVVDETTGETTYTDGVIEGDQYTYDENLDPTENYYNPLDNFVTVNPADTIVDSADFDFLKGKFEEFKDLFTFNENMQWLIIANNNLSNYFIGFIVLCAWFFTIGRILKG